VLEAPREGRKHRRGKWTRIPCFRRGRAEAEPVDFALEEVVGAAQVTVGVEGRANVGVPQDLLDGRRAGAKTEHERRGRVAEVVKAKLEDLAVGPELHPAARAPALAAVLGCFRVTAALAPALVDVALHDASASEGGAQDARGVGVLGPAAAIESWSWDRRTWIDGCREQGTPRQGDAARTGAIWSAWRKVGFRFEVFPGYPRAVDRIGAMEATEPDRGRWCRCLERGHVESQPGGAPALPGSIRSPRAGTKGHARPGIDAHGEQPRLLL
jgi:hypothetical protein